MKLALVAAALSALSIANSAHAATLTEQFENPFADWETRWFGTQSNAQNFYVAYFFGGNASDRGNNPDGLWVSDGSGVAQPLNIAFDGAFAASLSSFSLDIASHTSSSVTFFDKDGVALLSTSITPTYGATTEPGTYVRYGTTSSNGIGGFSFSGAAQGNISIDNLEAITGGVAVPEPATWAMMIGGFGLAGGALRLRTRRVAFAAA